jgi:universal stress protein A
MLEVRTIVCPVDFSETSRRALEYAAAMAEKCGSTLSVVHVVEDVPALTAYAGVVTRSLREEMEDSARRDLGEWVSGLGPVAAQARLAVIRGTPYKAIVEFAKREKADLIVMGTHGRSGFEHAFFGSVAERVLRRAPCPVLVVRPEVAEINQAPRK